MVMFCNSVARASCALVLGISLLLAGCAATEPRVLHFGMEDAPEGRRLMWPPPPEIPRFLYAGRLVGEENFRSPAAEGFMRRLASFLLGEKPLTVLQRPQSGTVDAKGRILVTDASRQAVFVFDTVAGDLMVWDKADGLINFVAPVGIATGHDGDILVADAELGVVVRLDSRGNPQRTIGRGVLKRPTGLAYDATQRRIFVADTRAHDIKVFSEDGRLLNTIGRHGEADGEFNFPTHIAYARGELYVTDTMNSRIQVFSDGGSRWRLTFGRRGLFVGNLVRPKGVTVDSDGNIYVVESYYDHLLVFNRNGEFLMGIGGLGQDTGKFYLPSGAWTDSRNRVFVADMFNGRVVLFQYLETGGNDG
ncbi:MAG: 6-bladed beta-propeller [Betaproteobacteria bacterium]